MDQIEFFFSVKSIVCCDEAAVIFGRLNITERVLTFYIWLNFVGLGLLCAIFDWEHFFGSFGCREYFTWVSLTCL